MVLTRFYIIGVYKKSVKEKGQYAIYLFIVTSHLPCNVGYQSMLNNRQYPSFFLPTPVLYDSQLVVVAVPVVLGPIKASGNIL